MYAATALHYAQFDHIFAIVLVKQICAETSLKPHQNILNAGALLGG